MCGRNLCVAMQWESPTHEGDTGRAGALMSNTDGLLRVSAGEFPKQVQEPEVLTSRKSCHINSEKLYSRPMYLASSERIINIVHNKIESADANRQEQGDKTLRAQQPRLQVRVLSQDSMN